MSTDNPLLNWEAVRKGRRSARSKNCEAVVGKSSPGKTVHVPIKKRRHLFRSSSPQRWMPSFCLQDYSPQQLPFLPPFNDDNELLYQRLHSVHRSFRSYPNCKLRRTDSPTMVALNEEFDYDILSEQKASINCGEDFSGIELLAAAAIMDLDFENASIEDDIIDHSSVPIDPKACTPTQSKLSPGCFELDNITINEDVTGYSLVSNNTSVASQNLLGNVENDPNPRSSPLKVDRRHWDLNTVMDAWDEPYNELVPGNASNYVSNVDVRVEGRQGGSEENIVSNSGSTGVEFFNLEVEENKLKEESLNGTSMMLPKVNDILHVPDINDYSNVSSETSSKANAKIVDCPFFVEKSIPPVTVEKIESPGASVGKIESLSSSVGKIESPLASVEKIESLCASVEKIESPCASVEKIEIPGASDDNKDSTVDAHDLNTCLDSKGHMIGRGNSTLCQEGSDSPYEDGELRGSFLYSWEDNELDTECVDYQSDGRNEDGSDAADLHGSEIVDGGSEGSHGSDRKSLVLKRFSSDESNSRVMKNNWQKYFGKDDSDNNEIGGKNESNEESVMGENEEAGKRRLSDQRDALDNKMERVDEYTSRTNRRDGRSSFGATDGIDVFFMQHCRSQRLGGTHSRSERDACSRKYVSRYRHTHLSERGVVDQLTRGSRSRYTLTYHGDDRRSHSRIKSMTGDSIDKFGRLDFDKRQAASYLSKGFYGSVTRRPSVDQDGCSVVQRKMCIARCEDRYRRRNYSRASGGEFEENFESPNDDGASTIVRVPPYMSRKERSFSPCAVRGIHTPLTRKRSHSRSRTRSPMAPHSHRERNLSTRRQVRSPNYRSEARNDKMRVQLSKSTFASDFGEEGGYISRSRGCRSRQLGSRWVDDPNFENCHSKRQRSPVTVFRRTQRFDAAASSGRLKSDEFIRPTFHPKGFSYPTSDDRECQFGANYDRKRNYRDETARRGVRASDGGKLRRFRHAEVADDFEASNSNNEDAVPQG